VAGLATSQGLQRITWLRKRQRQRWQQRQQQPWQRRQQVQRQPKRRRKQQELRRRRQEQVRVQELVLPRQQVLVLERVLPSCHKRRVLQQRSGRPERESSSFRFS